MAHTENSLERVKTAAIKLLGYCRENDWAGYDPYDALNSGIFKALAFLDFRLFRLGLTQITKRIPFNFRPLLFVPKTQNPKALGLFLNSLIKLSNLGLLEKEDFIGIMTRKLEAVRSANTSYWCWGYSFPWQTRTILVPRGAANLVCTVFVADALLNAYERNGQPKYLHMAVSAAEYILNELYWNEGDSNVGLSYPLPTLRTRVHNANFLGAALLCRAGRLSGEKKFLEPALKVARYSAAKQYDDGSWDYGEESKQRWADNFHTGYNLCALRSISRYAETTEFEPNIRRGFEFYRQNFFREDGAPKYFHNRTYPIDIHSAAQSIITLLAFKDLDEGNVRLALSVFDWAMLHMWDEGGYFYYQAFPIFRNKISYMRWSQAWMLLALTTLLEECDRGVGEGSC
jgi:hypothetical protein